MKTALKLIGRHPRLFVGAAILGSLTWLWFHPLAVSP